MFDERLLGPERHHHPGGERRHDGHDRAEEEQALVRRRRDDDLLEDQLHRVGDRLQQAERADPVRAGADLAPADRLALPERQVGDAEQQRHQQRDDPRHRPDRRPGGAEGRGAEGGDGVDHPGFAFRPRSRRRRRRPGPPARARSRGDRTSARARAVSGWAAGTRITFDASEGSTPRRQDHRVATLRDAHQRAVDDAALGGELARHAGDRRPRIGGHLQGAGAADDGVDRVDRHVGDPLEGAGFGGAGTPGRAAAPSLVASRAGIAARSPSASRLHLFRALEREAAEAEQVAEDAQHLPGRPRLAARLDDAVEALHPAFGIDEACPRSR